MNKSALEALFINAKVEGARYIGVLFCKLKTSGFHGLFEADLLAA